MSFLSQYTSDDADGLASSDNHDYTSVIRKSSEHLGDSSVESLTTLAGRHLVHEASCFFEELQADLSSIVIPGDNADELWCLLDWHRYILAVWTQQLGMASHVPESKWVFVKESWEVIIEAAVSLNIRHALPSKEHQRSILQVIPNTLSFEESLYESRSSNYLRLGEKELVESIVTATREEAWATPLAHEAVFTGLIDSARDTIVRTRPSNTISKYCRPSIQRSEFSDFIRILHEELKLLVALLPMEQQDEFYWALERAFNTALHLDAVDIDIRYLQFYHSLLSTWPSNDEEAQLYIEETFQRRVQRMFEFVILSSPVGRYPESIHYTVQDLEDILALGADVRGEIGRNTDCVLWAAAGSKVPIQIFEALVYAGAPYVNEELSQQSPLHAAASAGNLDIVAFLLASERHHLDINVNDSNEEGQTALHSSVEGCKVRVVDLLLQQPDIDTNHRDRYGDTPFLSAIMISCKRRGKYAVIKRLIQDKRVDCDISTLNGINANALHLAASLKDATLKVIINHVRGINEQDCNGETPLHYAVDCHSKQNIEVLLNHGADPTIPSKNGLTPLVLACSLRHLGPMEILLGLPDSVSNQCPAPFERYDGYSGTPDHWSPVAFVLGNLSGVPRRRREHIGLALKLILAAKPDLEVRDGKGRTVLSQVIETADEYMIEDLLEAGANPSTQDNNGLTPLHLIFSPYYTHWEKVKLLLEWGADPTIQDMNGITATEEWEHYHGRGQKVVSRLIMQRRAESIKLQQEGSLQTLAEKAKAYTMKQRQKEDEKRRGKEAGNRFSILTVEETESAEDDEEPVT